MEAKNPPPSVAFPHVITKRNGKATIYRVERSKAGRTYVEFKLGIYDSVGKRTLTSFADFDAAVKAANTRLDALGRGLVDTTILSGPDRLDYLNARRILGPTVTLTEAAQTWQRHQEQARPAPIRVSDAVAAFIASREAGTRRGKSASEAYLNDIRRRLTRFSNAFQCDLGDLTTAALEAWIAESGETGRNRFNSLRLVRTLLKWAQRRGHLLAGPLPTDPMEIAAPVDDGPIEVFTPAELRRLLTAAKPQMLPYVALGAFAGLRTAETSRLDWRDVKLERGFIEISAGKAKTASRRLVPVLPALAAWLGPIRKPEGLVLPYSSLGKQVDWLARDAGVEWRVNGLRHSFVTYRLAELQDVARVALEAGNSPAMIFRHYRELATPDQARAWFAVFPETPANVIAAPMASAESRAATG